jgi:transposase
MMWIGSEHSLPEGRVGQHPTTVYSKRADLLYRARNLVERFFNKIRRVATRYDKLAANYLAFVQLASIRMWPRVNGSTKRVA